MLHAQVLVLAQVGGNLFRPARHQASVVAGVILEDAIGAEHQVHGIFGSPGPGADAAQSCDFLGQFSGSSMAGGRNPMGIQPSPSVAARRIAALVWPPTQMGGCGFCTGLGRNPTPLIS